MTNTLREADALSGICLSLDRQSLRGRSQSLKFERWQKKPGINNWCQHHKLIISMLLNVYILY